MFGFFRKKNKPSQQSHSGGELQEVTEKQLKENMPAIESLRDYDTGKKDISTSDIERRLPDIRVTGGK